MKHLKLMSLFLAVLMLMSLFGCGNENDVPEIENTQQVEQTPSPESTPDVNENNSGDKKETPKLVAINNVDDGNAIIQFEYDPIGRLIRCYYPNPDGAYVVKFKYERGRLTKVDHVFESNPDMSYTAREYNYNSEGQITSWIEREGGAIEYICENDEKGNVVKAVCDSMYYSETLYYTYNENSLISKVESSTGRTTEYFYDEEHRLLLESEKGYTGCMSYLFAPLVMVETGTDVVYLQLRNEMNHILWSYALESGSLVFNGDGYIIRAEIDGMECEFDYQ